jgi:penicillin-binding protein 2
MFRKKVSYKGLDIAPDEIFLDSQNLMEFDQDQMEGKLEKPVSRKTIGVLSFVFVLMMFFMVGKLFDLQVVDGQEFSSMSENNRLRHSIIFATRGNVLDKHGELLVWNEPKEGENDFPSRVYADKNGFSNLIGYIKYPQKDKKGFYYELNYRGIEGVEEFFDGILSGKNGKRIVETNALGDKISENTIEQPTQGESVELSIDAGVQEVLFNSIKKIADENGFVGGGGVIMDVNTGEILAMTTYPELDSAKLTEGNKEYLSLVNSDSRNPFLNRITQGLYTPGSIMKPFMALAALNEGVIDSTTNIVSRGELEVPNPYDPGNPTYFSDWKAHGSVDIREALAVSSNIYFYVVGGGYGDIEGLGISRIEKYIRKFGFGQSVPGEVSSNPAGIIPNPEWKAKSFDGDIWRLGDTYLTAIGQYGFQVTPLQVVRGVVAIANGGKVLEPRFTKNSIQHVEKEISDIDPKNFQIVREGMRLSVTDGTAKGLNMPQIEIAAKTGTAELGVSKATVNSWTTGFFPYQNPKYAFVVVMEKGSRSNLIGGVAVSRGLFEWLATNRPEYVK